MLSTLITSATRRALLVRFFSHPGERFYATQLIRELGLPSAGVQKELARFEASGLVTSQREGNMRFYAVNTAHFLYSELKSIVYKTEGLGDALRKSLGALNGLAEVRLAFIFGSVAAGKETPDSDLDVFVVGDLGLRDVSARLVPVLRDLGREPSIITMPAPELRERIARGEHLVSTVLAEPKLWIVGGDDELAAIVG